MNNVFLDDLPEEWNGYKVNTDFTIGIQMLQAKYDRALTDYEKSDMFVWLMFADADENMKSIFGIIRRGRGLANV